MTIPGLPAPANSQLTASHVRQIQRIARQAAKRKWAPLAVFRNRASNYLIDQAVIGPWEIDDIDWSSLYTAMLKRWQSRPLLLSLAKAANIVRHGDGEPRPKDLPEPWV